MEFYLSITEDLLNKALDWASTIAKDLVTENTRDIIRHARQSLLFSKPINGGVSIPRMKKNRIFDGCTRQC